MFNGTIEEKDFGQRPARRRIFGSVRDRIAAADPAFSRLRLASRALLSVFLSLGILIALARVVPLPIAAYGLALVISFLGSTMVRDQTALGQALTRLWLGISATASVFLASLLAPMPDVAHLVFLPVIFFAVYVRSFGPRWFAAGMIAFMSYFLGDYMRPHVGDIGWIALAIAIGLVVTQFVVRVVLRDDPERDFRRAVVTIDRRINLILRELADQICEHGARKLERKRFRDHLGALSSIVLMAEGFIPQGSDGALAGEGASADLAIALFDLQLVVERMARAAIGAPPPAELIEAVLHHDDRAVAREMAVLADRAKGEDIPARLLVRVHRARLRLEKVLGAYPSPAFSKMSPSPVPSAPKSPLGRPPSLGLVPVPLQLPIQVTLACAIALGCGLVLSDVRWYWAVIAAFIVFNNTRSRADTALKALQRSVGTLAGLFVGTAAATLLHGHMIISTAAIPVLFFFAFYFVQTSYGVMIFLITIALALLYGVMGMFTPELLLLRFEETVIGALAGAVVAFFVFPARTSLGVEESLEKYLTGVGDLVAAARKRAHGETTEDLMALSRLIERSYSDLALAARPLGGPWNAVTRFGEVRTKLLLLAGCAHWGRSLAQSLEPVPVLEASRLERIDVLASEVAGRVARAHAIKSRFFDRPRPDPESPPAVARPPLAITENVEPAYALEVISALLARAITEAPKS